MKAIILCLVCVLAVSNGLSMLEKYPTAFIFTQKRSIMNVMTQIEATIKMNGPMDAIKRILDQFEQELRQEQIAHDALFEKQTKECNEEKVYRKQQMKQGNDKADDCKERLDGCVSQKRRAEAAMVTTKKNLKSKTSELINTHSTRTREKYAFDTQQGIFSRMRPAVDEALEFIEKIFSGDSSFLQLAKHSNKMLIQAAIIGQSHHMAPILSALSQLASSGVQADNELMEKLKTLFNNFAAKLDKENSESIKSESAAIKKYKADVKRLKNSIAKFEENIKDLGDEIVKMKKCINIQTNKLNVANAKVLRNSQLLKDAKKMCDAMVAQYKSAKKGRFAELELLDAIKVKVTEYFAKIAKGVKVKLGFKAKKHKKK